jgi:hypothetical protein
MASNSDRSQAINEATALRQAAQAAEAVSKFVCTVELHHRTGIVMVYGGKKAAKLGISCMLRLAMPTGTAIPSPERIARMGGLNVTIPSDKVRWACNWTSEFLSRDWKVPLTRQEESQLALARYIMIGIREQETARETRRLKKRVEEMDYEAEWRKAQKEAQSVRPKKRPRRTKAERRDNADDTSRKKVKKKSKKQKLNKRSKR